LFREKQRRRHKEHFVYRSHINVRKMQEKVDDLRRTAARRIVKDNLRRAWVGPEIKRRDRIQPNESTQLRKVGSELHGTRKRRTGGIREALEGNVAMRCRVGRDWPAIRVERI
jgi:hypothetical protein